MPAGATHPDEAPQRTHEGAAEHGRDRRRAASVPLLPYAREEHQRARLLKIVRASFLIAFLTVTILAVLAATDDYDLERVSIGPFALLRSWWITTILAVLFAGIAFAADRLTPTKKISTLGAVFFGLVVAMLASFALGSIVDLIADLWDVRDADGNPPTLLATIKVLLGIGIGYICIATVLQTKDDFRLVIPYVEFAKQLRGPRPLLLDSSTLIDARIADVAALGIAQTALIVPRFVVEELQTLADSADPIKRSRGRRGLGVVARLRADATLDVVIDETSLSARGVDQMLVDLARRTDATIATTDAALASVAGINGAKALSMHDLARACTPITHADESFRIQLVREGEQPGQAVGYLDDGTMVVVNNASNQIGAMVRVAAESTIPTAAGRLIFAKLDGAGPEEDAAAGTESPPVEQPAADNAPPSAADTPSRPPTAGPGVVGPAADNLAQTPTDPPSRPVQRPSQRQRAMTRRNPRR
ncbi:MAG: hypothetical protein AAFR96_01585 [Planctomycetota bacterium]